MKNIIIYCPNCAMKHRIKFLDDERFDVEFKCQCGEIVKVESDKGDELLSNGLNYADMPTLESAT